MAKEMVYKCDVCGVAKGATNNWWDIFSEFDEGPETRHLEIHPFDPGAEDEHSIACGQKCAMHLISNWMSTGELKQ